ncbi:MAG TPA: DUF3592 domain-containing protein [Solimonas sp.]
MRSSTASRFSARLAVVGGWSLLAALFAGFGLLLFASIEAWHKYRAESWPVREARVQKSQAVWRQGMGGGRHGGSSAGNWYAEVCVRYADTGTADCIRRIRFGDLGCQRGWVISSRRPNRPPNACVEAVIARYPPGLSVAVHHEPGNPRNTVLEARSSWAEMVLLLGTALALLCAAAAAIVIVDRRRRSRDNAA